MLRKLEIILFSIDMYNPLRILMAGMLVCSWTDPSHLYPTYQGVNNNNDNKLSTYAAHDP